MDNGLGTAIDTWKTVISRNEGFSIDVAAELLQGCLTASKVPQSVATQVLEVFRLGVNLSDANVTAGTDGAYLQQLDERRNSSSSLSEYMSEAISLDEAPLKTRSSSQSTVTPPSSYYDANSSYELYDK